MPPSSRHRALRPRPAPPLLAALATLAWFAMADAPTPHLAPGRYVVDALEHLDVATLEGPDGRSLAVPRSWLPARAREGDVLATLATHGDSAESVRFEVDPAATEERRRALQERRDGLPGAPSGDLEL
jgi:hypothetical protein